MKKMKAPEGLGLENYKFTELPLNKIFNKKFFQRCIGLLTIQNNGCPGFFCHLCHRLTLLNCR